MKTMKIAACAFIAAAALAACGKGDNQSADTTTVPSVDTTMGMAMPTTDTIVKTTTTDTLQGEANDTTKTP